MTVCVTTCFLLASALPFFLYFLCFLLFSLHPLPFVQLEYKLFAFFESALLLTVIPLASAGTHPIPLNTVYTNCYNWPLLSPSRWLCYEHYFYCFIIPSQVITSLNLRLECWKSRVYGRTRKSPGVRTHQ